MPHEEKYYTLLDREVLVAARVFAAQRGISVNFMLAEALREKVVKVLRYEHSKQIALSMLKQPWLLGGRGIKDREALHDRTLLR